MSSCFGMVPSKARVCLLTEIRYWLGFTDKWPRRPRSCSRQTTPHLCRSSTDPPRLLPSAARRLAESVAGRLSVLPCEALPCPTLPTTPLLSFVPPFVGAAFHPDDIFLVPMAANSWSGALAAVLATARATPGASRPTLRTAVL